MTKICQTLEDRLTVGYEALNLADLGSNPSLPASNAKVEVTVPKPDQQRQGLVTKSSEQVPVISLLSSEEERRFPKPQAEGSTPSEATGCKWETIHIW